MWKQIFIVTLVFICTSSLILPKNLQAQSPTREPSKTPNEAIIDGKEVGEASSASTEAIKELILKKVVEQAEEAEKTDQDDSNADLGTLSDWRKAVMGQIEKITDNSIAVKTKFGNLVIATDADLTIWKKDKKALVKSIEIGNWLLILGTTKVSQKNQPDILSSLKPQSLFIYEQNPMPKEPFMEIGTVQNISKSQLTILSRSSQSEINIVVNSDTNFQDLKGATASAKLIEKDIAVLVTGYKQDNLYTATTLMSLAETKPSNE